MRVGRFAVSLLLSLLFLPLFLSDASAQTLHDEAAIVDASPGAIASPSVIASLDASNLAVSVSRARSDAPPLAATALPHEEAIRRYAALVDRASQRHGVEGALVHALIFTESTYNPRAVSPAGATGLMQLMPETARRYGVRDLFDPAQNINGGVRLLKELLDLFGGNLELALAAYNSGANAVIRYGNRIPPHPETEAFVPRVLAYYRWFQAR